MTRQGTRRTAAAYYPLFADVHGRRCVVIGGGAIAERKVTMLLRCGARVIVVSPTVTRRLRGYARTGTVRHVARRFRPADLQGAWLVHAATEDPRTNERVFRQASRRRIFTNVVDQPSLCSFIAPAIARRGTLTVAVSTGGASPTVAKWVRDEMDRVVGSDYARLVRLLHHLRGVAKQRLPSYHERKRYFDDLVRGRVFQLIQAGQPRAARREALALLGRSARRNGT